MMHQSMRALIQVALIAACAGLLSSEPVPLYAAPLSLSQSEAVTPDGGRYYGPLVGGMLQGHGRIEWDNGARYEGGFAHGFFPVTAGSNRGPAASTKASSSRA